MLKKLLGCTLVLVAYDAFAVTALDLYQAPLNSVKQFPITQKLKKASRALGTSAAGNNALQEVNLTQEESQVITRYQQMYRGVPVVGAQIMITRAVNQKNLKSDNSQVNGHLLEDIQIDTHPTLSGQQAIEVAKKSWAEANPSAPVKDVQSELQIRAEQNNELKLVYLVSFRSKETNNKPDWPFFVVDAQSGQILKQWNNIKDFSDVGAGGNEKVHEYWYGKDGLPGLEVLQNGDTCLMETPKVKLVNLQSAWDWDDSIVAPFKYTCGSAQEEPVNGAFSPINDAYYSGHTIVDMYKDWYGVNALQHPDGVPMQLMMRVHFGTDYDNAFWDGQAMSFGDGSDFYPLVSLDVAGHEVTHGFTEQHANLEYHDQSGALNESLSDMAGQASRAYLLEKFPQLYNKMYLVPDTVTWGIGETIVRGTSMKALRFMDFPSSDGSSADCLYKSIAQSHGAYCAINYADVVAYAREHIKSPQARQGYIVHTASGVFNKAFYLLSKTIGIKKAYQVMITANSKYWTPTTNFEQGACGVIYGARDLAVDTNEVKTVFGQVGIDTSSCKL